MTIRIASPPLAKNRSQLVIAVPSQGQNICDALFSIADLANSGQKLELKVDTTDPVSGCTIQVDVKIDKEDVTQEKLDFKIDRSCPEGQAQLLGLTLDLSGATACSIKYDNAENEWQAR